MALRCLSTSLRACITSDSAAGTPPKYTHGCDPLLRQHTPHVSNAVSRREVVRRGVSSSSDSLESAEGRGANITHTAFVMCGEMDLMACAGPTAPAAFRIAHNKPPLPDWPLSPCRASVGSPVSLGLALASGARNSGTSGRSVESASMVSVSCGCVGWMRQPSPLAASWTDTNVLTSCSRSICFPASTSYVGDSSCSSSPGGPLHPLPPVLMTIDTSLSAATVSIAARMAATPFSRLSGTCGMPSTTSSFVFLSAVSFLAISSRMARAASTQSNTDGWLGSAAPSPPPSTSAAPSSAVRAIMDIDRPILIEVFFKGDGGAAGMISKRMAGQRGFHLVRQWCEAHPHGNASLNGDGLSPSDVSSACQCSH
mmetsp:Transcript_34847/g.86463  ORF Transcript_34847/g.86463 Transcript_34847/m.86463 type:complete len:369 (-) Transcript_34847:254-1360(-)